MIDRERLRKSDVMAELSGREILTCKQRELNTFDITFADGERVIRYHHTNVITFKTDGNIVLNSYGWLTPTTKERMNNYLPRGWNIRQKSKVWYLCKNMERYKVEGKKYTYQDGLIIHPDDSIEGAGVDPKELLKLDRRIQKYTKAYIKALFECQVDKPGPGDCFYCGMREVGTDKSLGECTKDNSHLLSHMEEDYFVPSLIVNAVESFPVSIVAKQYLWYCLGRYLKYHEQEPGNLGAISKIQLASSLKRYLRRQLGLAA